MAVRKKMKLAVPGNPLDPIDTLCKILTCDSDYSMVKSVGCLDPRFQHRFALSKELMEQIHKFLRALKNVTLMLLVFSVILTVLHFPYDADAPLTPQEIKVAQEYYTAAYQKPVAKNHEKSGYETEYLRVAQAAALPFPDDSFDGIWSIWVFEHVPNPEQAFSEARRVAKDKGVLFLLPAWNCTPWAADGYEVRPYSDFSLGGKLIKASIPLRSSPSFRLMYLIPNRIVRSLVSYMGPTKLRYRRLTPN